MTQIHQYQCDRCLVRVDAKWNGEHWLAPAGWIDLMLASAIRPTGSHLCDKCFPKVTRKGTKK